MNDAAVEKVRANEEAVSKVAEAIYAARVLDFNASTNHLARVVVEALGIVHVPGRPAADLHGQLYRLRGLEGDQ